MPNVDLNLAAVPVVYYREFLEMAKGDALGAMILSYAYRQYLRGFQRFSFWVKPSQNRHYLPGSSWMEVLPGFTETQIRTSLRACAFHQKWAVANMTPIEKLNADTFALWYYVDLTHRVAVYWFNTKAVELWNKKKYREIQKEQDKNIDESNSLEQPGLPGIKGAVKQDVKKVKLYMDDARRLALSYKLCFGMEWNQAKITATCTHIQKLIEIDGVSIDRVRKVIASVGDMKTHTDRMPVFSNGRSFREKFLRIEKSCKIANDNKKINPEHVEISWDKVN